MPRFSVSHRDIRKNSNNLVCCCSNGHEENSALGYSRDVSETASVGAGINAGYMNYDDDGVYAGFDGISDINLKVNGSAELAYGLGIGVTAAYTIVPDDDINKDNEFLTLTSLTYSF